MMKKDVFFVLLRVWDKEKILSSHEELNLWPSDSALWCSTTEPESEQRIWKSKVWLLWYNHGYLMVIWCMLWCSTTELELEHHLSYSFYKLNDTCLLIGSFLWSIGNKCIDDLTIEKFFFLYHITQIDSMLPWICSAVDHRR